MNPAIPIAGKRTSAALNDAACTNRESINGTTIPPTGIPSFMIPITIPDISRYLRPARAMMSGKMTEIVAPETIKRMYAMTVPGDAKSRKLRTTEVSANSARMYLSNWLLRARTPSTSLPARDARQECYQAELRGYLVKSIKFHEQCCNNSDKA